VEAAAAGFGRTMDDQIMIQSTATAQTGVDASNLVAETFSTASWQIAANFASSAAAGLTVQKLIETKRILRKAHAFGDANPNPDDPLTLIIGSQQEADLLNLIQIVSTEFNDKPVLTDGKITRFLDFDIVISERVPQTTVGTTRGVIA